MSGLVHIATFPDTVSANIFRGRLEAEGIFVALADQNLYGYGGYPVRVLVTEDDVQAALAIKKKCEEA